jgi:hypothetical protein
LRVLGTGPFERFELARGEAHRVAQVGASGRHQATATPTAEGQADKTTMRRMRDLIWLSL